MEEEIIGLISTHHKAVFRNEGNNKYSNVLDKLRNPKVGETVAWSEFQPVLEYCVENYPLAENLQETLRQVFELRRKVYRLDENRDKATTEIREIVNSIPKDQRNLLDAPMVCIRDLFNLSSPKGKSRI